ncbi:MAG: type IV pilin N-terminal domain-containing protein, partial [Candidatus Thermoplasmatota archaeon]
MKLGRGAVSEIVGSILTLAITVTLFSAVMAFVLTYPGPTSRVIADLVPSLNIGPENATISISHKGGETLKNEETSIDVDINGTVTKWKISDSNISIGTDWSSGEVWSRVFNITYNDSVVVRVIAKNVMILDAELQKRGLGVNPPTIHFAWSAPQTVALEDSFKIFAVISDRDNDVKNVTVDLSAIGLGMKNLTLSNALYQTQDLQIPFGTKVGSYFFELNATDYKNNYAKNYVTLRIVSVLGATDLSLSRDDISISNRNPVKGDNIFINVIVRNLAAEAGTGNLTLYDENV